MGLSRPSVAVCPASKNIPQLNDPADKTAEGHKRFGLQNHMFALEILLRFGLKTNSAVSGGNTAPPLHISLIRMTSLAKTNMTAETTFFLGGGASLNKMM